MKTFWGRCAARKRAANDLKPCLPGRITGTVPEPLRQRHCARGAAAGGMLYTRPLIRDRAPPTLAAGQPEAARGSRGVAPRALLWFLSWASKKGTRCRATTDKLRRSMSGKSKPTPGRDPAIPAAEGGTYKAPRRGANKSPPPAGRKSLRDRRRSTIAKLRRSVSGKSKAAAGGNRRTEPHSERQNRIRGEPRANTAHTMTETRQNRWER